MNQETMNLALSLRDTLAAVCKKKMLYADMSAANALAEDLLSRGLIDLYALETLPPASRRQKKGPSDEADT